MIRTPKYKHKHPFRFRMLLPNGKAHILETVAIVKTPKRGVRLPVKAAYAAEAIRNDGCGNSQLCTVSTAIAHNAHLFSHPVVGIVDYYKSTAFVASKVDKKGMVTECYRYVHDDDIADRNDTPGRLKQLHADLEENGDQVIRLSPRNRKPNKTTKGGTGKVTGERSSISMPRKTTYAMTSEDTRAAPRRPVSPPSGTSRGEKRRYAVAMGGRYSVPAVD